MGRDIAINQIFINSNTGWGITIVNILSHTPTDMAITLLAAKLGFANKLVIGLILAFLI